LSSGISTNILDFGIPQKHVLIDMTAMVAGRKAGDGEVRTYPRPAGPEKPARARNRVGSNSGKQGREARQ